MHGWSEWKYTSCRHFAETTGSRRIGTWNRQYTCCKSNYRRMEGYGRTNLQHSALSEQLARSENYYSNYHPDCHYPTPPCSTAGQDPASAMSVADSPYRTSAAVAGIPVCPLPSAWQIASPDYPECRTCRRAAASGGCSSSYAVAACFGFGGESAFVVEGRRHCFAVRIIRRI